MLRSAGGTADDKALPSQVVVYRAPVNDSLDYRRESMLPEGDRPLKRGVAVAFSPMLA